MSEKTTVTFQLPVKLKNKLARDAKKNEVPIAMWLRTLIKGYK